MFKKTLLLVLISTTALLSSTAFAELRNFSGKVSRISPHINGDMLFRIDIESASCTPQRGTHYFRVDSEHLNFDAYYSMLLASAHAGTTIIVRADNAACNDDDITSTSINYILQDF